MAVNTMFRTLAFALRGHISDTYALLTAVDSLQETVEGLIAQGVEDYRRENAPAADSFGNPIHNQNVLNHAAAGLTVALDEFNASRTIMAIKEVRAEFSAGLKAAKDAVQSEVFAAAAAERIHAEQTKKELADLRYAQEWRDYNEAASDWCCDDCSGPYPTQPLAEWERELLGGE